MFDQEVLHEDLEVTVNTMAIVPVPYGGRIYSKIFEIDDEYVVPEKPIDIIKKSCRFYASSFEGRREGTKELIGITHKSPIVIDPVSSIYFFPTTSPNRPDCCWFSLEHVQGFFRKGNKETEVLLSNKQTLSVPISANSFRSQYQRTSLLQTKMQQRLLESERRSKHLFHDWQLEALERKRFYRF